MLFKIVEHTNSTQSSENRFDPEILCLLMRNEYHFPLWFPLLPKPLESQFMIYLKERQQKEEEDRKQRIQLYVFVLRSIAYPFNAKQPGDMTKRHIKITKEGLEKLRARVEV